MAFLRFGQSLLTNVFPHQANRRFIMQGSGGSLQPYFRKDYGDRPNVDPGETFTRGSSAWGEDENGVFIESLDDVPRAKGGTWSGSAWTDGGGGRYREPERTTHIRYVSDHSQWTQDNVTGSDETNIFGYESECMMTETAVDDDHRIFKSTSGVSSGTTYTVSFYIQSNNRDYCYVRTQWNNSTAEYVFYDLTGSGSVHSQDAFYDAANIEQVTIGGETWFRCQATGGATGTIGQTLVIGLSDDGTNLTYLGSTSANATVSGIQVEDGAWASSPMDNNDANTLTRSKESWAFTRTYNDAQGAFVAHEELLADGADLDNGTGGSAYIFGVDVNSTTGQPLLISNAGLVNAHDGTNNLGLTTSEIDAGEHKFGVAWQDTTMIGSVDGSTGDETSETYDGGWGGGGEAIEVGQYDDTPATGTPVAAIVKRHTFYNALTTQAQLNELTAS